MSYDADEPENTTLRRFSRRIGKLIINIISYSLFALGVVAFYSFFAGAVEALPTIGLGELLPSVVAPTEAQYRYVDVVPLIVGVAASSIAVWLR